MDPDSIEDSVYLNLATSIINAAGISADDSSSANNEQQASEDNEFNESDNEPLIKKAKVVNKPSEELVTNKHDVPSDFSPSDDEPLIQKQAPYVSDSADPTYLPSEQSETSQRDSESDTADSSQPGNKTRARKRHQKPKRQSGLLRTQAESLTQAKKREESVAVHQARLDNFLSANGLVRKEIHSDGNCFLKPLLLI